MQGIYIEVGMGSMETYDADFEAFLLADSAAYYQRKAAAWIQVRGLVLDQTCCSNEAALLAFDACVKHPYSHILGHQCAESLFSCSHYLFGGGHVRVQRLISEGWSEPCAATDAV